MAHEFLVKDIAYQAGLSTATVDRVLNDRPGVRRQTRLRVDAAIAELKSQQATAPVSGRTYIVDVVMEAPDRFTDAVRQAFESEAASFYPATFRSRFHFWERTRSRDLAQLLQRIGNRPGHGLVLKAPETPDIIAAVDRLVAAGRPVLTLVTDLPQTARLAYAGIDNEAAGRTAAYLMDKTLGARGGAVLVTLSSHRFLGEVQRETGFRAALAQYRPDLTIIPISENYGDDTETGKRVRALLAEQADICAVYSIGGGNRAIVKAFAEATRPYRCFVAHDLDADNRALLQDQALTFVLDHDLRADIRFIYRSILQVRSPVPRNAAHSSAIQIVTPQNMPV